MSDMTPDMTRHWLKEANATPGFPALSERTARLTVEAMEGWDRPGFTRAKIIAMENDPQVVAEKEARRRYVSEASDQYEEGRRISMLEAQWEDVMGRVEHQLTMEWKEVHAMDIAAGLLDDDES